MAVSAVSITPVPMTMDFGAGAVSPDAIMEYCNAQLGQIDGKIDTLMKQQDDSNKVSTELNAINQDLQKYSDGYNVAGVGQSGNSTIGTTVDKSTIESNQADIDQHYQNAIDAANASGDSALATELTTAKGNFDSTASDDCLSSQEVSDQMDGIKNAESDAGNNSQMVMINLQQLLSQRQQAISITSNMLQTCADTNKSVISNIHSS